MQLFRLNNEYVGKDLTSTDFPRKVDQKSTEIAYKPVISYWFSEKGLCFICFFNIGRLEGHSVTKLDTGRFFGISFTSTISLNSPWQQALLRKQLLVPTAFSYDKELKDLNQISSTFLNQFSSTFLELVQGAKRYKFQMKPMGAMRQLPSPLRQE